VPGTCLEIASVWIDNMTRHQSIGVRTLLGLYQAGDEEAARRLVDQYVDRLVGLARSRISERLAGRVDPEDIVQSVFRTFFGRVKEGKFQIADQDDLCKLLMRITVCKAIRQARFHQAFKRSPQRERGGAEPSAERLLEVLDREPSPEAVVAFMDELENFLGHLEPIERQILELRMQDYSCSEIATQLGTYERKVRRVIERIRSLAQQAGLPS
jgi:RNA polymerase sigma-70 factor (ECF subfamily)